MTAPEPSRAITMADIKNAINSLDRTIEHRGTQITLPAEIRMHPTDIRKFEMIHGITSHEFIADDRVPIGTYFIGELHRDNLWAGNLLFVGLKP